MLQLLKELCEIDGTSSREQKVADYVRSLCEGHDVHTDPLGNVIVNVKGKQRAKNKVMLCAHMDEVGVMATCVTSDGLIKFITVGGIRTSVLAGRTVRFENGTVGVVGIKPVHLCTPDEKTALPDPDFLYIDVGAKDKDEALVCVQPGDTAVFTSEFVTMGDKILSKAIDDRAGCAVMLDMIKNGVEYDTTFVFNVQEEVGLAARAFPRSVWIPTTRSCSRAPPPPISSTPPRTSASASSAKAPPFPSWTAPPCTIRRCSERRLRSQRQTASPCRPKRWWRAATMPAASTRHAPVSARSP